MRRALAALAILLAVGGAFAWGFLTGDKKVFPFKLLRKVAERTGAISEMSQTRETVQAESLDVAALAALPYLQAAFDPNAELSGVVYRDEEKTDPGLNLYVSVTENEAKLIDMNGRAVRSWSHPGKRWQFATLAPDGNLIALSPYDRLLKLDGRSNLLWEYESEVHHDLDFDAEGNIYVLSQRLEAVPSVHPNRRSLIDTIEILDPAGQPLDSFSVLEVVQRSPYRFLLPAVPFLDPESEEPLDILHTNHVEVLDGSLAERSPIFAAGNLLISIRNLNAIAILEHETWDILWLWGPSNLTLQHHPTPLENGNILIFNNGKSESSIIELDPLTQSIVWRYAAEGFFSRTRGSVQRLANGNTLITDSDKGYAFEITPDREVVWNFANPDVTPKGRRSAIFRMTRYAPDAPELQR